MGLVTGLLLLAGCASYSRDSSTTQTLPAEEVTIDHTEEATQKESEDTPAQEGETGALKQFSVKAFRFGFEPSALTVKQGDTVFIQVTATDVKHGFAIPEYGVNLQLEPGQEQTAVFVADKKGTFKIFCSVPCGSGHSSMQGQFIVE